MIDHKLQVGNITLVIYILRCGLCCLEEGG